MNFFGSYIGITFRAKGGKRGRTLLRSASWGRKEGRASFKRAWREQEHEFEHLKDMIEAREKAGANRPSLPKR